MYFVSLQLLGVELLSVLHRLLLTWDPPSVQLLVTGVVQQIVRAAQDYLQEKRNTLSKILKTRLALQSKLATGFRIGKGTQLHYSMVTLRRKMLCIPQIILIVFIITC